MLAPPGRYGSRHAGATGCLCAAEEAGRKASCYRPGEAAEDIAMMRAIYGGLGLAERHSAYPEILAWVRSHPEIAAMNATIAQKSV